MLKGNYKLRKEINKKKLSREDELEKNLKVKLLRDQAEAWFMFRKRN